MIIPKNCVDLSVSGSASSYQGRCAFEDGSTKVSRVALTRPDAWAELADTLKGAPSCVRPWADDLERVANAVGLLARAVGSNLCQVELAADVAMSGGASHGAERQAVAELADLMRTDLEHLNGAFDLAHNPFALPTPHPITETNLWSLMLESMGHSYKRFARHAFSLGVVEVVNETFSKSPDGTISYGCDVDFTRVLGAYADPAWPDDVARQWLADPDRHSKYRARKASRAGGGVPGAVRSVTIGHRTFAVAV